MERAESWEQARPPGYFIRSLDLWLATASRYHQSPSTDFGPLLGFSCPTWHSGPYILLLCSANDQIGRNCRGVHGSPTLSSLLLSPFLSLSPLSILQKVPCKFFRINSDIYWLSKFNISAHLKLLIWGLFHRKYTMHFIGSVQCRL